MKIVIVEDEFHTRMGLSNYIKSIGEPYKLLGEAEDGQEGMLLIKKLQPDLVITDVRMPKLDGLKMIANIVACNLDVKFVILSGYAEFEYAQKGISLGVEEYLLKPVSIKELKETLDRINKSLNRGNQEKTKENIEEKKEYSPLVTAILADLEANYAQKISLDDYAEKFNLTPEYISNVFSKEMGIPLSYYLTQLRIEKAKNLLKEGKHKIYEIACMVGYNDVQYFCRVFKKVTGLTTSEYFIRSQSENKGRV